MDDVSGPVGDEPSDDAAHRVRDEDVVEDHAQAARRERDPEVQGLAAGGIDQRVPLPLCEPHRQRPEDRAERDGKTGEG